jgi:DNA topoisomerase-6 subunit B
MGKKKLTKKSKSKPVSAPKKKAEDLELAESAPRTKASKPKAREDAESMAKRQREISVSEFFAKNRHLLGFDNPRKALLTAVKEAVDNSLDACEEAGILPDIQVELVRLSPRIAETEDENDEKPGKKKRRGPAATERFELKIIDNGPGILVSQIPKIFGKLLYGSKFHRLKMSRGQQGIGISAAGMYGQMTTGIPVKIISKLPKKELADQIELKIDTKTNKPLVLSEKPVKWPYKESSGTSVCITLEGRYQRGRQSIDEFILQNTLSNPHASFSFKDPEGESFQYERSSTEMPDLPAEIKPHPYGVELGQFHRLAQDTGNKTLKLFLMKDFSRVSESVAAEILKAAGTKDIPLKNIKPEILNRVHEVIPKIDIKSPPTHCVIPIGEELLVETLRRKTGAEFFTASTRTPSVYRGNPFIVECAIAHGGDLPSDEPMQVFRFANRVPLLFQPAACASVRVMTRVDWKKYGLSQSKGALPIGPVAVIVHVASVWVPFTSESKEAIADYPEIKQEIRLAILDCARKMNLYLSKRRRALEANRKANYIDTYIPFIGEALQVMLKLKDTQRDEVVMNLRETLEKTRVEG